MNLTGSVSQLVEQIEESLSDIDPPEDNYPEDPWTAEHFRRMVPHYLQSKDQNRWLLNHISIQKVRYFDKVRIVVIRVKLWIKEDEKTGLAYVPEQETSLVRNVLTVDSHWITEQAEALAEDIETVNVEQALLGLTTTFPRREGYVDDRSFCEMIEEEEEAEEQEEQYEFFGRSRFNLQKLRI
ncbi:hypothetical protein BGZ70_009289 [Mortierella alpina]|uniref:Uncharacterized protein n=1 Tax=Mortierella alpina TaxID=64518 RepID=A0A9P6J250_MORAP|nr:hypothetical protein BGZ70_009289 [Mortierella alpina]